MDLKKIKNIFWALLLTVVSYAMWLFFCGIIIFAIYGVNQCIADDCYPFLWWEDVLFFSAIFISPIIIGLYFLKKFVFTQTHNKP